MAGFILLVLPLSVLAVFILAALAITEVAFRDAKAVPAGVWGAGSQPSSRGVMPSRLQLSSQEILSSVQRLTAGSQQLPQRTVCTSVNFVPLVTDPEARAIADELRQRGDDALNCVVQRSRQHGQSCPMQADGGLCLCGIARPLSCVGRCSLGGDSPEWATGLGETIEDAFRQHLELHHVNAGVRRLDDALVCLLDRPVGSAL